MPKGNRSIISLECPVCKRRNYSTTKNKRKSQDKLELRNIAGGAESTPTTRKEVG